MLPERPPFPCDLQAWPDIRQLLRDLRSLCVGEGFSLADIVYSIENTHTAVQAGYKTNDFDVVQSGKGTQTGWLLLHQSWSTGWIEK